DRAVTWRLSADEPSERRKEIDFVHDLVADAISRHSAGKANNKWSSQRAFHRREVRPRPWPGPTTPREQLFWAIVTGKNHQRIFVDAKLLKAIENLSRVMVELRERVGKVAEARPPGKVRMRQRWIMHERERHIRKKRPVCRRILLDE